MSLKQAVELGDVGVRGSVGQCFSRAHPKGSVAYLEYHSLKTDKQKAAFRLAWAKKRYEDTVAKKFRTEQFKLVDSSKGTYLPFRKVWEAEGMDRLGLEAAQTYVRKC
eukprot:2866072-Lingulodinium_polyedra.AAC.1